MCNISAAISQIDFLNPMLKGWKDLKFDIENAGFYKPCLLKDLGISVVSALKLVEMKSQLYRMETHQDGTS